MNAEQNFVKALYVAYKNNIPLKIMTSQIFRDSDGSDGFDNTTLLDFENENFWKNMYKEEIEEFIEDNFDLEAVYHEQFKQINSTDYSFSIRTADKSIILCNVVDDKIEFNKSDILKFLKEHKCDLEI